MAKHKKFQRQPYVLFGEGPTEELFLSLLKQLYSKKLSEKFIKIGNGSGGSPGSVLLNLEKKILSIGESFTPTLVLIDEDKGLDNEAQKILKRHTNEKGICSIQVVFSKPQCLEGFLLDLLDDPSASKKQTSNNLKFYFYNKYLGEKDHVLKNFKANLGKLFSKKLLEDKKMTSSTLAAIYQFLGL